MSPVLAVVPLHGSGEESSSLIHPRVTSKVFGVSVEDNLVRAGHINADSVVGEALSGVEVEYEDYTSPLKNNDLVVLVLERDVRLRRGQPAVLALGGVHCAIKVVQKLVSKQMIISEVQLASSIPERVLVALAREVKPFRMAKFIALKVQVAFAAESVGQQTNHLVEGHAAVNNRRQGSQS